MKAVVFAYHNMGMEGIKALARNGYEIAAVFTHEDDPGENCWFGSVQNLASKMKVPLCTTEDVNNLQWVEKIRTIKPDVIFSFYYRKMISGEILAIPEVGAFNLHGSLLPAYRGRCPANWVLVNGETKTGVTLHYMIEKPDAGDIVGQKEIAIDFTDTARTLYDKLCAAAGMLLDEILPQLKTGKYARRKQDLNKGSYYGGRKPQDGRIFWDKSALEIYNLIRAVTEPYPGAFALADNGDKIIIWRAQPVETAAGKTAGDVQISDKEVLVQTGKNAIRLLNIEIAGRRLTEEQISNYFTGRKVKKLQ